MVFFITFVKFFKVIVKTTTKGITFRAMNSNTNQVTYCIQMFYIFVLKCKFTSTSRTFHYHWVWLISFAMF